MVNLHLTQNLHIYSWSTTWHLQSTISNGGQLLSRRCWGMVRMDGSWPKFQCDRPLTTACWADGARMTQDNSSSVRVQRVGTSQSQISLKNIRHLNPSSFDVFFLFLSTFPTSSDTRTRTRGKNTYPRKYQCLNNSYRWRSPVHHKIRIKRDTESKGFQYYILNTYKANKGQQYKTIMI